MIFPTEKDLKEEIIGKEEFQRGAKIFYIECSCGEKICLNRLFCKVKDAVDKAFGKMIVGEEDFDCWEILSENLSKEDDSDFSDLVKILERSRELKKRQEEEEFTEKCLIASKILSENGIDHKSIESVHCDVHKEGTPFISIWYRDLKDKIVGIVLEHHGSWKIHIHDGKVID